MLDLVVTSVPEGLEEHYKEENDGSFVLDVKGVVPQDDFDDLQDENNLLTIAVGDSKKKVKEFREHNVGLRKQIENAGDGDAPQYDALVDAAVSEMRESLDEIKDDRNNLKGQLEEVVLSDKVKDIAIMSGVHESALPDIVSRARALFTVEDGKPVPKDKKSRDSEGNVLTPESWLKGLEESAPHLFKSSQGGGAQHPASFGGGVRKERTAVEKISAGINKVKSSNKNIM